MFPLRPVPIHVICHVLWLFVGVLKKDIGWLFSALVGTPLLWHTPRFSGGLHTRDGQDLDGHIDTGSLASLEESLVLEVDFEDVLDLEDLTHPGRAQVQELWRTLISSIAIVASVQATLGF